MSPPASTGSLPNGPRGPAAWIPALRWIPGYKASWLRGDLVAGVPLGAYLLPAGLFSGLVFWLFCSSRHTAVTVTLAIPLRVRASVADAIDAFEATGSVPTTPNTNTPT